MKKITLLMLIWGLYIFSPLSTMAQNRSIQFEEGDWASVLAKAKKTKKPIFVDAYASWCGPCKWMAREVFTNDTVADYFNATFVNFKIDMEKGEGVALRKSWGVKAFPTLLYFDAKGEIIGRIVGGLPPTEFVSKSKEAISEKSLSKMQAKYDKGNTDKDFLKDFVGVLETAYMIEEAQKVAEQYLVKADSKDLLKKDAWEIFVNYATDVTLPVFVQVSQQRKDFDALYTVEAVEKKIFETWASKAKSFTRKDAAGVVVFDDKGWTDYAAKMKAAALKNAEEIEYMARLHFLSESENWEGFAAKASERASLASAPELKTIIDWNRKLEKVKLSEAAAAHAAQWTSKALTALGTDNPEAGEQEVFMRSYQRAQLTKALARFEGKTAIIISGQVKILNPSPKADKMYVLQVKEGRPSPIDSFSLLPQNYFQKAVVFEYAGPYMLSCMKEETVTFWAEEDDVEVYFDGYDTTLPRFHQKYIRIKGGEQNERMNQINLFAVELNNWSVDQYLKSQDQTLSDAQKEVYEKMYTEIFARMDARKSFLVEEYQTQKAGLALLPYLDEKKDSALLANLLARLGRSHRHFPALDAVKKERDEKALYLSRLAQGKPAPLFSFPTADGKKMMGPEQFKGKILVVDFWASWCGPCRREIPHMKELYAKYKSRGVEILGVSVDRDANAWKKLLESEKMPWAQVLAPEAGKPLMKEYQFNSIPHMVLLNEKGEIVGRGLRGEALIEAIDVELARLKK